MPNSAASDFSGEIPRSTGSNSGRSGKLVLLDDLAREIARQHELDLARHGLGVERLPLLGAAVAAWPQEYVLAPVDQDACLGFEARRDEIDGGDGSDERQHRRHDDPATLAGKRAAERVQIDVTGFDRRLLHRDGRGLGLNLGFGLNFGSGFDTARSITALSLPARQNAKRIEHSRRTTPRLYLNRGDYTPLRLPLS